MNNNSWRVFVSIMALYFLTILVPQNVSAQKPFYEGKTVTVLVNYAAGGPTDVEGRSSGGIIDQDGHRLALVEGLLGGDVLRHQDGKEVQRHDRHEDSP